MCVDCEAIFLWLIKTDSEGNEVWSHMYGDIDTYSRGYMVKEVNDGYVIVGETDIYEARCRNCFKPQTD